MARRRRRTRRYYYYQCPECPRHWVTAISRGNVDRQCRSCDIDVHPYRQKSEPELDPNRPCFGHYKCLECSRTWMSANSWVGFGQKCETCKINVMPHTQTPLRPSHVGDERKAHPSELCGKCLSLGRNCRRSK